MELSLLFNRLLFIFGEIATVGSGINRLVGFDRFPPDSPELASVVFRASEGEDGANGGLPNFGLSAGAASDLGWVSLRSFKCLNSNLLRPSL